jgi:hypothetical protein
MLAMVAEKISHAFTAKLQMLVTQTPLMLMILTRRSVLIWTIRKGLNQVAVTDFFRKWIKMNESLIDLSANAPLVQPICLCLKV